MAQNPPNATESFAATKSKAVTEEDVRVSNRLNLKDLFETDVSEDERLRRTAELELLLIARFETLPYPLVYLGSAGSFSVQSSELRVMAAREIARLMFDVQTGFGQRTKDDNEAVEREQKEATKAHEEQQKQHDKDESVAEPTNTLPVADPATRSTQPEQELELLARFSDKAKLENQSPKLVKEDSVVDTNRTETPPRRENTTVATGANVKPDGPAEPEKSNTSTDKR